jgi:pilus assembly protein CpaF
MPMESHREVMPAMDDDGGEFGNEQATPVPFPSPAAPPPPQSPLAPAPLAATAIPQAPSPLAAPVLAAPSLGVPSAAAPQRPMARALEPVVGNEYQDALGQVVRTAQQRGVEGSVGDEVARARLRPALEQIARGLGPMPAGVTTEKLTRDALAEIAGTGALETVLEEAEVSAVVIDGAGAVHAARSSPLAPTGQWFSSPEAAAQCLDRWLQAQGIQRHGQPVVQAVTAEGIRVTAAFAPVSARGVVASLERPIPRAASLQELSTHNVLSSPAVALLSTALAARRNVVVVGALGAGRTTLLAALLAELPAGDRVAVVEARDELSRARRSAASLRVHNGDWSAPVALALQLRTGRVVFGDCNAAVAQAFVGRLTTGVEGMLVGVEAPSAQAGIARLAAEATRDGWFDKADALARLAHTRPLVVEVSRGGDGALRVSSLGEARPEGAGVRVEPLFTLRVDGADAQGGLTTQLIPTGASPSF